MTEDDIDAADFVGMIIYFQFLSCHVVCFITHNIGVFSFCVVF